MLKKERLIPVIVLIIILLLIWFFVFGPGGKDGSEGDSLINSTSTVQTVNSGMVKAIHAKAETIDDVSHFTILLDSIDRTELNAIVLNVKDDDEIHFGPRLTEALSQIKARGIYSIARIVVFRDRKLGFEKPHLALKDPQGIFWRDSGGYVWVDPASREVWDYNLGIAKQALALGFDEVNFDYARFPSDGDVVSALYPVYRITDKKMEDLIADFSQYITSEIRKEYPSSTLSVDVFAHSFVSDGDVGVGQRLTKLAQHFDIVSPMIYPALYAPGSFGFASPHDHPYEVTLRTLESGKKILESASLRVAVRPWVQSFNSYGLEMIEAELKGVEEAGFGNGWMVWNPSNWYYKDLFKVEATISTPGL